MKVLVVGGTGPTGPAIVAGLEARGHEVTICHTGSHEVAEVEHLRHIHVDVRDHDLLASTIGSETWDTAIVTYGRLRTISDVLAGQVGHFISVGGGPAYRGYFDPSRYEPPGLPAPVREDAATSTEDDDGTSYRIAATEQQVFAHQPEATTFAIRGCTGRASWRHGGRSCAASSTNGPTLSCPTVAPCSTRSAMSRISLTILLAVDQPEAAKGEIFNVADDECLSLRQVVDLCRCARARLGTDLDAGRPARPAWPLLAGPSSHHRLYDTSKLRSRLGYADVVPARGGSQNACWLAEHLPPPADKPNRSSRISSITKTKTGSSPGGSTPLRTRPHSIGRSHPATASPTQGLARVTTPDTD